MIDVSPSFHDKAFGQVIAPKVQIFVAFEKQLNEGSFFTLGQSELDGPDILRSGVVDVPAQNWDFYNYKNYTDRLVSASWSRSLEFPYQIQCGQADFTMDNTDGLFTPLNPKSPIGEDNLPSRPMRLYANYAGSTEVVPQMCGLTQELPDLNTESRTVDYHAIDFLYDICNQTIKSAISMREVRTDQVIAAILEDYGLAPSQYQLAQGQYTVPFVFFDIGENAGTALKQLVQSENGFLWLDEKGIVRFETASSIYGDTEIVATLGDYDIVNITPGQFGDIVNHVRITAEVREVQEWQEVYTKTASDDSVSDSLWVVPANGTFTISCGLGDPCYDVVAPTLGRATSVSWFTAQDAHLDEVTDGVTATGVLSSNAFTITFTNTHSYAVEINEMKLWGEPAKVYDVIDYDAYDDESVEAYGNQLLEITDNQFFQTYSQANNFGKQLIGARRDYNRMLQVEIKGDFSFQLMDMIKIETTAEEYDGIYHILGISYQIQNGYLITTLTLNGTGIKEGAFTLNFSHLNGEDLIQ